jgi:hypothetical protein
MWNMSLQTVYHMPLDETEITVGNKFQLLIRHSGATEETEAYCRRLAPWQEWISGITCLAEHDSLVRTYNEGLLKALEEIPAPTDLVMLLDCRFQPVEDPFQPLYERLRQRKVGIVVPQIAEPISENEPKEVTDLDSQQYLEEAARIRVAPLKVMALKWEVIYHLGVFDENFKEAWADTDYSYTARSRGWEIWEEPKAKWCRAGGDDHRDLEAKPSSLSKIARSDNIYFQTKWKRDLFDQLSQEVFA